MRNRKRYKNNKQKNKNNKEKVLTCDDLCDIIEKEL